MICPTQSMSISITLKLKNNFHYFYDFSKFEEIMHNLAIVLGVHVSDCSLNKEFVVYRGRALYVFPTLVELWNLAILLGMNISPFSLTLYLTLSLFNGNIGCGVHFPLNLLYHEKIGSVYAEMNSFN